jgi:hypothetical protein
MNMTEAMMLDQVLQEEPGDERHGEVELLVDLAEHQALLAATALLGVRGGKERRLHSRTLALPPR